MRYGWPLSLCLLACGSGAETLGPPTGDGPEITPPSPTEMNPAEPMTPEPMTPQPMTPPARPDVRCTYEASAPLIPSSFEEEGPYDTDVIELTFTDRSRGVSESPGFRGADERRLKTRVHYPAKSGFHLGRDPVSQGGPFPLVVYAHGFSSSMDESNKIGEFLASHGYIVAAPNFPKTNMAAGRFNPDVMDVFNQPADLSFIIDQFIAESRLSTDRFAGAIDESRIAAMGVSLGGLTTYLVSFHPRLRDSRIKAAIPIAAPAAFFSERFFDDVQLPLLVLHGDLDAFIDYEENARVALERAQPNANLVTVINGSHTAFGLPVDAWLLDFASTFIAPDEAHPDNPDGLGCGFVADGLQTVDSTFVQSLGGEEDGIMIVPELLDSHPCQGREFTQPAMEPAAQMHIARAAALSFLEATFSDRPTKAGAACRYLNEGVREIPGAIFE